MSARLRRAIRLAQAVEQILKLNAAAYCQAGIREKDVPGLAERTSWPAWLIEDRLF
jgi:hypothetical protein